MDVRNLVVERNSEQDFYNQFSRLISAGVSVIHVRTHEIARALATLRTRILCNDERYHEWDVLNGFRSFNMTNREDPRVSGDGEIILPGALERVWRRFVDIYAQMEQGIEDLGPNEYFVFVNPHFFMENNPTVLQRFIEFSNYLVHTNINVVVVTPSIPLPAILADYVVSLDYDRPGHGELTARSASLLEGVDGPFRELDAQTVSRLAVAGSGMTVSEFETALSRSIVDVAKELEENDAINVDNLVLGISRQKTEIVKKNDLLELMHSESMRNVGGMENLKEWVALRSRCYSPEATEFGIEPPKGLVLVGVPGTGKSLAAKAVSSEFGIPLIRLDFSKVFNALVGSSEQRMRTALQMIEAMAPCVCFADEIDKGLGGIGSGGGDAGTSMRVLGTFLTWLQECRSPVFTIVTANNVNGLPPELLRRGRFDAIFSTTLPNEFERREVLDIHLSRRNWNLEDFPEADIAQFIRATDGFVPAEIEAAVKDALVLAFNEKEPKLEVRHMLQAASNMVPLSKSHAVAIASMVEWAQKNAIAASWTLAERQARGAKVRRRSRPTGEDTPANTNVRRITTAARRRKEEE
jgi:ATP-dependent 26S proteasome regulatory subunit